MERWSEGKERCEAIINSGAQCLNASVPGCTRCEMHGANKELEKQEKASLRLYRLSKHQARANDLTDHAKNKSLKEEIALLRILLEEKWNKCQDEYDLLVNAGPISDLVMKIERLVASCHKLDMSMGGLLDKTKIKQIASEILNSLATHLAEQVNDPDIVSLILESVAQDTLKVLER
jgi:hypothetical protein